MRILLSIIAFVGATSAANAGITVVPEFDAGVGVGALALVAGAALLIREKFFRK